MTDATNAPTATTSAEVAPAATPAATPAPAASAPAVATPAPAATETPAATPAPAAAPAVDAPKVPEKYEFKAPEGMKLATETTTALAEVAKANNLSQEAAQSILDKVAPAMQAANMKALTEFYADIGGMPNTWEESLKADKDMGGEKLAENLAVAKKAFDLGGPNLGKVLAKTGLGNHPDLVKWAFKVGKSLSEDKFISGGSGGSTVTNAAEKLYGSKS